MHNELYELAKRNGYDSLESLAFIPRKQVTIIHIENDGRYRGITTIGQSSHSKASKPVPTCNLPGGTNVKITPFCEKAHTVFPFDTHASPSISKKREKFWQYVKDFYSDLSVPIVARALKNFHKRIYDKRCKDLKRIKEDLGAKDQVVTFSIEQDNNLVISELPVFQRWWKKKFKDTVLQDESNPIGFCVLSRNPNARIANKHYMSVNLPQAEHGSGFISSNAPCVQSYGYGDSSAYSGVGIEAAMACTIALNEILKDPRHRFVLGTTTFVWWDTKDRDITEHCADLFRTSNLRALLKIFMNDHRASDTRGALNVMSQNKNFHLFSLSNNGRSVIINRQFTGNLQDVLLRIRNFFYEILPIMYPKIENPNTDLEKYDYRVPSLQNLVELGIGFQKKSERTRHRDKIVEEITFSIISGAPIRYNLFQRIACNIEHQFKLKKPDETDYRFLRVLALAVAMMNRLHPHGDRMMNNGTFKPFDMGKILAIAEIVHKYCARGNSPELLRDRYTKRVNNPPYFLKRIREQYNRYHKVLRKRGSYQLAMYAENMMQNIWAEDKNINPSLTTEEVVRFWQGYATQKRDFWPNFQKLQAERKTNDS